MPARLQRDDVGLALAERAGRRSPASQFDIAGLIERRLVITDQRFQIPVGQLCEDRLVPSEFRLGIALGPGEMRHAPTGHDRRSQAHCRDDPPYRLTEGIAALDRRLRRQVGIDVDRQDRVLDTEVSERNADRVIDLGGAGEGWIEALPIHLPHDFDADFARDPPAESRPANEPLASPPTWMVKGGAAAYGRTARHDRSKR